MAVALPTKFAEVAKAKTKEAKKEVLLRHEQNGAVKEILKYTFNPDNKFLLPPGNPPYKTVVDESENRTYL